MFIDSNENVTVRVYYARKGKTYEAYTKDEYSKLKLRDSEKEKYACLDIVMRQLTWGLQNDLQDVAIKDLPDGTTKFYYKAFKEGKLEKTIVSWSTLDKEGKECPVVDKDGKPIPARIDNIRALAPEIAEAIVRGYDQQSLMGDDEEKK